MNDLNNQGLVYNKNKRKYKKLVSKRKLKRISKNRLSQRLEEMDAMFFKLEGFVGNDKKKEGFEDGISRLEADFNQTLSLYKSKYREYLTEAKNQLENQQNATERLIRIVDDDGNELNKGYLINKHGVARMFNTDDWEKIKDVASTNERSTRKCPEFDIDEKSKMTDAEINKFTKGPNMEPGEFCGSGGRNVRYDNNYAWIDVKGMKHIYDNFNQRHASCPSEFESISEDQWNKMNQGSGWNPASKCEIIDHNTGLTNELIALNDKLIGIVGDMKRASMRVSQENTKSYSDLELNNAEYTKIVDNLKKEREELEKLEKSIYSLDSEFNKHYGKVRSIKLAHFIWAMAGLSFAFLILKYAR